MAQEITVNKPVLILLAAIVIAIGAGFLLRKKSPENGVLNAVPHYWTCPIPSYSRIELGMTKGQVEGITGKSSILNSRNTGLRSNVAESWAFDSNFSSSTIGTVEIYFDTTGHVNGKYCGDLPK